MRVGDVMTRDVMVISPRASVREAARKMDQLNVGALPVCDGRRLVGMITDRDITVRCTAAGGPPENTRVHEIMSEDLRWCFEHDPVEHVERDMAELQIRRMPVVDRGKKLVGIVSLGDLAVENVPGTGEVLRRISEPSEPDRSGTLTSIRGAQNAEGRARPMRRHAESPPVVPNVPARARDDRDRLTEPGEHARWAGYARSRTTSSQDEGLGESDVDYGENYYRGGYGGDRSARAPRGPGDDARYGGERPRDYWPPTPDQSERDYERSTRRDRPVFDRGEESTIFGSGRSHRGRGPRGYRRSDDRILEDINERLLEDPEVDATNIEIDVQNGEVTLSGTVGSRYDRRRAEDIVESVSGIRHIQNNLRIFQELTTGNASGIAGSGSGGRNPPEIV
jgi:CBS domain-containing protein